MPSLKITIELRETVDKLDQPSYCKVGLDDNGKDRYDYPPKRVIEVTEKTELYSQIIFAENMEEIIERFEAIIKSANGFD